MPVMVYLAEPIDATAGPDLQTDRLAGVLSLEFNVYRPRTAWRAGGGLDPRLDRINRVALGQCDVMVAHLPAGVPTIGVPMEIEYAAGLGIPVVVLSVLPSFALVGRVGVEIASHLTNVAGLVRAAAARPRQDSGGAADVIRVVLTEGSRMPSRAYGDDAGYDLYVADNTKTDDPWTPAFYVIAPGETADIRTGVSIQLPGWAWGEITGRSSTLRNRGLQVQQGVIDSGWRGELFTQVLNVGSEVATVKPGERLAQLIIHSNSTRSTRMEPVDQLDPHERGTNGFGSSGQ